MMLPTPAPGPQQLKLLAPHCFYSNSYLANFPACQVRTAKYWACGFEGLLELVCCATLAHEEGTPEVHTVNMKLCGTTFGRCLS